MELNIKQLTESKEKLEAELEKSNTVIRELQSKLDTNTKHNLELELQNSELVDANKILDQEKNVYKTQFENKAEELQNLSISLEDIFRRLVIQYTDESLDNINFNSNSMFNSIEKYLINPIINKYNKDTKPDNSMIELLKNDKSSLESNLLMLNEEVDKLKYINGKLTDQLGELEQSHNVTTTNLRNQLQNIEKRYQEAINQSSQVQNNWTAMKLSMEAQIVEINQENQKLRSQIDQNMMIETNQISIYPIRKVWNELKQAQTQLLSFKKDVKESFQYISSFISAYAERDRLMKSKLEITTQKLTDQYSQLKFLTQVKSNVEQQMEMLIQQNNHLQINVNQLSQLHSNSMIESTNKIKYLETQLYNQMNDEILHEKMKGKLHIINEENKVKEEHIDILNRTLELTDVTTSYILQSPEKQQYTPKTEIKEQIARLKKDILNTQSQINRKDIELHDLLLKVQHTEQLQYNNGIINNSSTLNRNSPSISRNLLYSNIKSIDT